MISSAARRFALSAAIVFVALHPENTHADDVSTGVMLPRLRADPPHSVDVSAASLALLHDQLEVKINIRVRRSCTISIQMPRFGWLGEAEPYPDRHFPELQVLIDAAPANVKNSFSAFAGSVDVTELIQKSGLDPFVISETPPFINATAARAETLKELERLGAVEKSGADYLARWMAQRTATIELTPGTHTLTLKYKGRPGYERLRFDQISSPSYRATYCLFSADLVREFGQVAANRTFAVSNYSVPLSIDATPPSSAFVSVAPSSPTGSSQRLRTAFCKPDGKAMIGEPSAIKGPGRTDPNGIMHIVLIESPESK